MNDKLRKCFGNISYDTYYNIRNTLNASSISVALLNDYFLPQYPFVNEFIDIAAYGLLFCGVYLSFSNNDTYTKDISEIRNLYQDFIKKYNGLNTMFGFNNPIEIYAMFNYLLYEGYLSKDKRYQFTKTDVKDINTISGANIITGVGVCRNVSSMLKDILNDYGIDAYKLGCYIRDYTVEISILKQQKYSKEELMSWIKSHVVDEQTYEYLVLVLDKIEKEGLFVELSNGLKEEKNPIIRLTGNHSICYAEKDGISYFLDPTQSRIYRLSESGKGILYDQDDDRIQIRKISSIVLNGIRDYLKMDSGLSRAKSCISLEEEQQMIGYVNSLCKQNMDIFEQFYRDNSELYDEISSRMIKVKKRT